MKSKVSVQPAIEPVTLAELKTALRITSTSEDSLLTQLIIDARTYAEDYTGRKFITQTLVSYDHNLYGQEAEWFSGYRIAPESSLYKGKKFVQFDWAPAQSVTSVVTIDIDNSENAYASSNYYLDNYDDNMFPRLNVNDSSTTYATSLRSSNAIKITWVAGYGDDAVDVPASIRRGILMMASHLYTNRGDCDGSCVSKSGANSYIDKYRILSV